MLLLLLVFLLIVASVSFSAPRFRGLWGTIAVFHYMCTAGPSPRAVSPVMQTEKEIPLASNTSRILPSC